MIFKPLISLCSSSGRKAKLAILIYHRVLASEDLYRDEETNAVEFDWQMRLISRNFRVIKLSDAVERMKNGTLPARAMCVTFDDGYADNYEVALPILKKWNVPATFFISTAYLNGGCMWNDRIIESISHTQSPFLDLTKYELGKYSMHTVEERKLAISDLLKKIKHLPYATRFTITEAINHDLEVTIAADIMMTRGQVKKLYENGMEIGAHTDTHPILTKIDDEMALSEIEKNKNILEKILGSDINLFAYPNGKPGQDYNDKHVSMVKSLGFRAAVSTTWGVSNRHSDPYQLCRFTPWDKTPGRFMFRLLNNYFRVA
ncbi:MAG: polysaccharide deacetylase family protein [Gammaproteobacteria bacterium]|nr:polysaccharide deacetylase family protein [Gammaproteobacteria bacterium]